MEVLEVKDGEIVKEGEIIEKIEEKEIRENIVKDKD